MKCILNCLLVIVHKCMNMSGISDVNHVGTLNGIGKQPFNEDVTANISCAAKLKDAGFDIHWNTKKVDAMFVESPHDDLVRNFSAAMMDCIFMSQGMTNQFQLKMNTSNQ